MTDDAPNVPIRHDCFFKMERGDPHLCISSIGRYPMGKYYGIDYEIMVSSNFPDIAKSTMFHFGGNLERCIKVHDYLTKRLTKKIGHEPHATSIEGIIVHPESVRILLKQMEALKELHRKQVWDLRMQFCHIARLTEKSKSYYGKNVHKIAKFEGDKWREESD